MKKKLQNSLHIVWGNKILNRKIESHYEIEEHMLDVHETYFGSFTDKESFFKKKYKLWTPEQIKLAARESGFHLIFYDKKKQHQTRILQKKPNPLPFEKELEC